MAEHTWTLEADGLGLNTGSSANYSSVTQGKCPNFPMPPFPNLAKQGNRSAASTPECSQ